MTGSEPNNFTGWKNSEYDSIVAKAMSESNPQKRQVLYEKALDILLYDEVPVIPLLNNTHYTLVSERVKNFEQNFFGTFQLYKMKLDTP